MQVVIHTATKHAVLLFNASQAVAITDAGLIGSVQCPDITQAEYHIEDVPDNPDWVPGAWAVDNGAWVVTDQAKIDALHQTLPQAVPELVTMRQARHALLGAGLLSSVDAAIAALPEPQKSEAVIEWEYASIVQRDNPLVEIVRQQQGMTAAQIDDLFTLAATL
jgi:hypothetical protein